MTFSLDDTALRLDSSIFRLRQFLRHNLSKIADRTLGNSVRGTAKFYGVSDKQLNHLKMEVDDDLNIQFRWKWYGPRQGIQLTHRWYITMRGGRNPRQPPKALHWIKNGSHFFSKGHFIRGLDGKFILRKGIENGLERFKQEVKFGTEQYMEATKIR